MHIIVLGCGRVGSHLAYRLFQKGHDVVVVDNHPTAFENLLPDFRGRMVEGEGLSQDVMHRAGIEQADGLAAVTDSDPINAVVAHMARMEYKVPYVVVRNDDPMWRTYHEAFGHQIVSSASWGAQRIEELLYPTATPIVFSAGNGEVEVYECMVSTKWAGRRLQEMLPDSGVLPVALTRAGRAMLPEQETTLQEDDLLHLSATLEGIEALRNRIGDEGEG